MKILIDMKHPAHVHFFRNFISIMKSEGHEVKVTARDKDITLYLLEKYNIPYTKISSIGTKKSELIIELIKRNYRFYKIAQEYRPDIILDLMGITAAPVGFMLRIPSLVFYDTENARLTNMISYTLCTRFITPICYRKKLGKKNIRYNGVHELTYLHPNYFTPDKTVLDEVGIEKGETFTVLRFVSWGASHDIGHRGISDDMKQKIVSEFEKFGKVLITSEKRLPHSLEEYRITLPPEKIHSLIYYATLLYGESATMASEAAVLGTYAIYLDDEGRGYTDYEEKKYGLVYNFKESEQERSVKKGIEILKNKHAKKEAVEKREKLLTDMIDVTLLIKKMANKYRK